MKQDKEFFIKKAGSINKLAAILGITRQAITQWEEEIPEGRVWQLMVIKPEWFKATKKS
jgi:DNA-binding XRE family transcriptional regulator